MGWLTKILGKLRKLVITLQHNPSDTNFRNFYTEVELKLKFLNEDLRELEHIKSSANLISDKISAIKSSFEDILFLNWV